MLIFSFSLLHLNLDANDKIIERLISNTNYEFEKVKKGINLIPINEESEFKTLIGKNIKLSKGEKVFKRNNEIINFAGVMGGESTKCNSSTVTALVESAFFNPDIIIGKTVKYDLTSEASYRFERGVDALLQNFASTSSNTK